jgi:hypothetical protein
VGSICAGRKRGKIREFFANSRRYRRDLLRLAIASREGGWSRTACPPGALRADRANGIAVETISVALRGRFVSGLSFSSLFLLSVVEEESSEDPEQDAD